MEPPLVSILIPTYNRAEYLAECLDSCIRQSYPNFEVIVMDDGSTDSTPVLMRWFVKQDGRVKYFRQENKGIAEARNAAFKVSQGDYIAVMDSDDIMNPDRLKLSLKALKKGQVAYGPYLQADERATVKNMVDPKPKISKEEFIKTKGGYPHVTLMAERRCFEEHPYRSELKVNDDLGLQVDWFKAGYVFVKTKDPLVIVRYHDRSTSATRQKEVDSITEKLLAEL